LSVFVDTSALYALLDADQEQHAAAAAEWRRLIESDEPLLTTSYVLVETSALVQRRLGMTAVRALGDDLLPLIDVHWVDENDHLAALETFLDAGRRGLSLVDCTSFRVMRRHRIRRAFAFDADFAEQGITLLP
jgi:uncharacterized protein